MNLHPGSIKGTGYTSPYYIHMNLWEVNNAFINAVVYLYFLKLGEVNFCLTAYSAFANVHD